VIDIGVPRNADPELDSLDDVYLYDIDDLSSLARENAEQRQRESAQAETIVEEERQRFDGWLMALRAVPTIKHLRERAESIRSAELERALRRAPLAQADPEALDQLTRSIVNKILHQPVSRLRREAEGEEALAYLEAARALFGLDDEPPAEDE
jgi:glutamyl-tRNA reductase